MDSSIVTALAALLGRPDGGFTSFAHHMAVPSGNRQRRNGCATKSPSAKRSTRTSSTSPRSASPTPSRTTSPTAPRSCVLRAVQPIRLVSTSEVAQEAEKVMEFTINLYNAPNVTLRDIFAPDAPDGGDPRWVFGAACREELARMKRGFV